MKREGSKSKNSEKTSSAHIGKIGNTQSQSGIKTRRSSNSMGNARQSIAWRSNGKSGFKVPKYQNSYWLDPYIPFRYEVSDKILIKVMTDWLKDEYYSDYTVNHCKNMSAEILDQLYKTEYDRVKYVVMITIIENTSQSLYYVNSRLWDPQRDTYSSFVFDRPTFYAIGLVYVMNYE